MGDGFWVPSGCWGSVWLIRYGAERGQGAGWGRHSARLPCPLLPLDFGLAAGQGSQTGLLAPLALQGVEASGERAAQPGRSPSRRRSWREASSLARTRGARPSPRLCRQDPLDRAWPALAPPAPPSQLQRQQRAGAALAGGIGPAAPPIAHPSTTPPLHACKAAWPHGENGTGLACPTARRLHRTPGPSSASGCCDPAGLGAGGPGPRKQEEWL